MGLSKRFIAYGFARFGVSLGLISAILSVVGPEPILLVALSLWLLLTVIMFMLVFRKGIFQLDGNRSRWAATGLGIGFAAGFGGLSGMIYVFQHGFEWFFLGAIIVGFSSLTRSFLEIRRDWPRTSPSTRRFVRNLLTVNVPTIAFLVSYLFIVFARFNSVPALALAFVVYVIPNGVVFARRFKEVISPLSPPAEGPSDQKTIP